MRIFRPGQAPIAWRKISKKNGTKKIRNTKFFDGSLYHGLIARDMTKPSKKRKVEDGSHQFEYETYSDSAVRTERARKSVQKKWDNKTRRRKWKERLLKSGGL